MIACLDVQYHAAGATVACLVFQDWPDTQPAREFTLPVERVEPYESGQFYKRELPCLRAALDELRPAPEIIVIDGYVWLGDETHAGLGAHLYEALSRAVPVIGVAKTRFAGATAAREVCRGMSNTPLFVTAAGLAVEAAARNIQAMHGQFRLPTLLKRVDQLCRGLV